MAKAFSTMKTNVGNMLQDTSGATATLIGVWLNDGYQDAWARCLWTSLVDDDFTFESVADQAEYSLESDFGEDVALVRISDGVVLKRVQEKNWWDWYSAKYSDDEIDSGSPQRYVILEESSKIKLDPPPDEANTYAFPYKKTVTDLSGDTDTVDIPRIEQYMEYRALSIGFAYKRKFQVSDSWNNRAEFELQKRMKQERVKINQKYQYRPFHRTMSGIYRLMGDKSYDQI